MKLVTIISQGIPAHGEFCLCVSNLSPIRKNSVPPTLFPFLVSHYLNGLFLHIFLNVLNRVHIRPAPIITYLIIHGYNSPYMALYNLPAK